MNIQVLAHWWRRGGFAATLACVAALFVALIPFTSSVHAAPVSADNAHFDPPKQYYLALGDSIAFGWQSAKFASEQQAGTYDPASFNTGYVDDFARLLARVRPSMQTVNDSCSGETTASFIGGGCPYHTAALPLHNSYPVTTPQLAAALAFLKRHPGQVSPITLNLGSNDLANLYFGHCLQDLNCTLAEAPAVLAQARANLDQIVGALRAAAPSSEIIVLQVPDPFIAAVPVSGQLFQALNAAAAQAAAAHEARIADGYTPFTPSTICSLTGVCTAPFFDLHPTDAGYQVLAQALWTASGYERLGK